MKVNTCSAEGCTKYAAYSTRTRPAWCDDHITAILAKGGLEPVEPFEGPRKYRLCRCLICGCEAHYRFEYTLEQNKNGEKTCRACFWQEWAVKARQMMGKSADFASVEPEIVRLQAESNGYVYIKPLTTPSLNEDPHLVQCIYCGRISAKRVGDIGWGCSCQVNPKRPQKSEKKELLRDTDRLAVKSWDFTRNDEKLWNSVTPRATRKAWWICPDCGFSYEARVIDAVKQPRCARCAQTKRTEDYVAYQRLRAMRVSDFPELLEHWIDPDDPELVFMGENRQRQFRCAAGHLPRTSSMTYLRSGCAICRGLTTRRDNLNASLSGESSIKLHPEIAEQWHPTKNGKLDVRTITPASKRMIWWYETTCGHSWQERPVDREKRQRLKCPKCRTILDSLAYHFPKIASEWSSSNPITAWQVRAQATLNFEPEWQCITEPSHKWTSSLSGRTTGKGHCPMCREHGKSWVELEYFEAAKSHFATVSSGEPIQSEKFKSRKTWYPDITVRLKSGQKLFIEYDGAYWHENKTETDTRKTNDLIAEQGLVVRLREDPLPLLPMTDDALLQLRVFSGGENPDAVIAIVAEWVDTVVT